MNNVKQSIDYGSPYDALISGFISVTDILNYLLDNKITVETIIAYRAVCMFDDEQIIKNNKTEKYNNKPFILVNEYKEYVGVYNLSFGKKISGRNAEEKIKISKITQYIWPKLLTINNFSKEIYLISDCVHKDLRIEKEDIWKLVSSRSSKYISYGKVLEELLKDPKIWILYDFLEPIRDVKYTKYENVLLDRCDKLKKEAPDYWKHVGLDLYKKFISDHIDVENPKTKEIKRYAELFPNLFPKRIIEMSDLVRNMNELDHVVKAYVLGFPIHLYVPSEENINKAIMELDKIGIEEYCKNIAEQNANNLNKHIVNIDNIQVSNDKDNLFEKISDYNIFDVIKYYIDTHVYFFTRAEFPSLITSKTNPYTNKKIPISVLMEARNKLEISLVLKLPKSASLKDLLLLVEKNNLEQNSDLCNCAECENIETVDGIDRMMNMIENIVSGYNGTVILEHNIVPAPRYPDLSNNGLNDTEYTEEFTETEDNEDDDSDKYFAIN